MTANRYVLHHNGTWFYYLGNLSGTPHADGEPMEPCLRSGWYSTTRENAAITTVRRGLGTVTCYRLHDPSMASVRYPLELSDGEYDQRRNLDNEERLFEIYSTVREPGQPVIEPVEGPWLRLDGEPPPADGRSWVANLPLELFQHPEYLHLFPGYMPGFRDAMEQVIKSLPRVRRCFEAKTAWGNARGLEITLEVPFDKPQSEYQPARNLDGRVSRSRKGRTVPVTATRRLVITVPYRIDAANRADAAAKWDRLEAEIRAAIANASVAACSACMGHGYVPSGSDQYEKKP